MKSIVSEKGQVTIPKKVRESLGITPGTVLDFEASGGRLVGKKHVAEDAFEKWRGRGKLPRGMTPDEYLALSRGR